MACRSLLTLFALFACLVAGSPARAGQAVADKDAPGLLPSVDPMFERGRFELQIAEGAEISLQNTSNIRPHIDYQLTVIRLGYMLDSPRGSNFLRGNNELLLEVIGGPMLRGPGSALGGLSVMYRRNFLSPGAKVIPYLNVGAGGIYSDAYHDRVQQALGSMFEFDLQAGAGAKFRLSPRWTVDAEFSYRHLSNARITQRNLGTNGIGGLIGVSHSF